MEFDDENTVVEDVTRCVECGSIAFIDDFTPSASAIGSGILSGDRCVAAPNGRWHYCAGYSKEFGKLVMFMPR